MEALVSQPWIVVVVPAVIALILGAGVRYMKPIAPWAVSLGPALTVVLGLGSLLRIEEAGGQVSQSVWATSALASQGAIEWFTVGQTRLTIAWAVDSLTAIMLLVVGVVATCVVVFSAGYMKGDKGWVRYFALISLFTASMNLLVIGSSFTTLFMGWELVGACSYLLIGFWYEKPSASAAAIKAFITTRVGDVGLLLGIALLWMATGGDSYDVALGNLSALSAGVVSAAAVCLVIGALGKSAQFPLHAWLPDAMEGPTPVSALIHAATMVAAGVFLVARLWPLFEAAPEARMLLLTAGAISAFGAGLVALVQRDIKKVLAYSTISQLGFMFAALGAGAWAAAFFHLVTHAAFKALLFLGSGSVIHGTGTQDLHEMGGLRKAMPVTFVTWVVGMLALAGVFPFAGFFSKDAVLEGVWHASPAVAVLLFASSGVTAFYAARSTRLAFFGKPAEGLHAHESGLSMLVPLLVLAFAASTLGLAAGGVAELLGYEPEPLALAVSAAALGLAALGGLAGWLTSAGPEGDLRTAASLGGVHSVLSRAYGWDAMVDRVVVRPTVGLSRALWAVGDRLVVDGAVEGSARVVRGIGRRFSALQRGDGQVYATAIVVGFVIMLVATVWIGR